MDKENRPPLPRAGGVAGYSAVTNNVALWLDQLGVGVQAHIQTMQQQRDELVARALQVALADLEAV